MTHCFGMHYLPNGTCLNFVPGSLLRYKLSHFVIVFLMFSLNIIKACMPTQNGNSGCCPELEQSILNTDNAIGIGTTIITFNSDTCRTSATVTCMQPSGEGFNLRAAIVIDGINFIAIEDGTVTDTAACVDGAWQMANPPLVVQTLECWLTDT
uniref:C6 domain-containing protein n=1 Tax=Panagrellus redivivus TaxID=6233 RepID=A0A7E4W252_PANRE